MGMGMGNGNGNDDFCPSPLPLPFALVPSPIAHCPLPIRYERADCPTCPGHSNFHCCCSTTSPPSWTAQSSGVTSRLRGVSAVNERVVWASGSQGTVIRSQDGGTSWQRLTVPDAEKLDFRDVDAVDERTAYVLSIGNGDASRIYKTSDAGATWTLQFRNEDPKAFFDAMTFRDARTVSRSAIRSTGSSSS